MLAKNKLNLLIILLILVNVVRLVPEFKFNISKELTTDEALSAVFSLGLHKKLKPMDQKNFSLGHELLQNYSYNPILRFHQISKTLIELGETHPALYYFSLSYWIDIFGLSKTSIRLHALLGFFIFIVILYFLSLRLVNHTFALICVLLAMMTTHVEHQMLNARMHIWTLSFSCLLIYTSFFATSSLKSKLLTSLFLSCSILHSFLLWPMTLLSGLHIAVFKKRSFPLFFTLLFLVLYALMYAGKQVENIPFAEFMYNEAFSWSFIETIFTDGEDGVLALFPFHQWLKTFNFILPLYLIGALFILYKIKHNQQRWHYLYYAILMTSPYLIDFITGGTSSIWASARSINFIMIPILLVSADFIYSLYKKNRFVGYIFIIVSFLMTTKLSLNYSEIIRNEYVGQFSDMKKSLEKREDVLVIANTINKSAVLKILLTLENYEGKLLLLNSYLPSQNDSSIILKKFRDSQSKQLLIVQNHSSEEYALDLESLERRNSGEVRIPTGAYDHFSWELYYPKDLPQK